MDKKTLIDLIIGGISLTNTEIWIISEQGIGLNFEMLEP